MPLENAQLDFVKKEIKGYWPREHKVRQHSRLISSLPPSLEHEECLQNLSISTCLDSVLKQNHYCTGCKKKKKQKQEKNLNTHIKSKRSDFGKICFNNVYKNV